MSGYWLGGLLRPLLTLEQQANRPQSVPSEGVTYESAIQTNGGALLALV